MLMSERRRAPGAESLGRVEYVVESGPAGARETWLVMRANPQAVSGYARMGLDVAAGSRVVVEATSLRPIGVLDDDAPNHPAGFNPYFDPPLTV
jgi:hypothetical protein